MRGIGSSMRNLVLDHIGMLMDQSILGSGKMVRGMEKEK